MKQEFYSNGKLLLIGEYTVLDGSDAFALPTTYGQYLTVQVTRGNTIRWTSYDADGSVWFEAEIQIENILSKQLSGNKVTDTLIDILNAANSLNPRLLAGSNGFSVETKLTFPRTWGLGSSSTLINNIAQWFNIDAFELLQRSFGGSGYDIACAQNDSPIIFSVKGGWPNVKAIDFNPDFTDKLWFVYLNKKQDTKKAVAVYRENADEIPALVAKTDAIIAEITATGNFAKFRALLDEHSALISKAIQTPTVTISLFPDFNGTVKSLGAWGGDFILTASQENPAAYFASKGYPVVIPYSEMILSK
ncbi:MAG: GYDIA family GHMP kinase [Flavobacterium sp.]